MSADDTNETEQLTEHEKAHLAEQEKTARMWSRIQAEELEKRERPRNGKTWVAWAPDNTANLYAAPAVLIQALENGHQYNATRRRGAGRSPASSPVESAAPEPASSDSGVDALIAEFEQGTQPASAPTNEQADNDVEAFLRELETDPLAGLASDEAKQQINQLQGQNSQLLAERQQAQEAEDLRKFFADVRSELPSWVPKNFAETAGLALAAKDVRYANAWAVRHIDPKAAAARFDELEKTYNAQKR